MSNMNKKMRTCKTCDEMISKDAETCPHCGESYKKSTVSLGSVILYGVLIWFIISLFISTEKKQVSKEKILTQEQKCEKYQRDYNKHMNRMKELIRQGRHGDTIYSNRLAGVAQTKYENECNTDINIDREGSCSNMRSRVAMLNSTIKALDGIVEQQEEGSNEQINTIIDIENMQKEINYLKEETKKKCE